MQLFKYEPSKDISLENIFEKGSKYLKSTSTTTKLKAKFQKRYAKWRFSFYLNEILEII